MTDMNQTQMVAPPTLDPNKTMMGSAPTLNATQTIKQVQCPVCMSFNPPGVMFCVECGLIFDRALPGDAFGAPAVQLPVLVDSSGREHVLRPGDQVIGRQGDIMIEDARISRRHLRVSLSDSSIEVEDLGSTNGSKVAGAAISVGQSVMLQSGEIVSLGGFELTLSMPGAGMKTEMPTGGRTAAIQAPTVRSCVAKLEGGGAIYELFEGSNSFGRKDENDVVIKDPYVSGRHGVIEVTDSAIYVSDIGSTNGTLVADEKLVPNERVEIPDGGEIQLGSLNLKVRRVENS